MKKQLNKKEDETYRSYHCPGMPNYARRSKNTIVYSASNTNKHELAKAIGGLMLHKWGEIKFTDSIVKSLRELDNAIDTAFKDWEKNPKAYITESVPNKDPARRVDLVRLEDDYRFEFEVNHKIKKDKDSERTITILI